MPGMCTQVPEENEGGWREKTHKKNRASNATGCSDIRRKVLFTKHNYYTMDRAESQVK